MARNLRFTVGEALDKVLNDKDDEFFGGAEAAGVLDLDTDSSGEDDDMDVNVFHAPAGDNDQDEEAAHFLDIGVDVQNAAQQFFDQEPEAGAGAAAEAEGDIPLTCCKTECLKNFDAGGIQELQLSLAEMTRDEKDLVVLGLLESCHCSGAETTKGKKRERNWFSYSYKSKSICATAFRKIFDVGTKQFENLKTHLQLHGPVPRIHGNRCRRPKHALTYPAVEKVATFLKAYAKRFGIPHPAPLHGRADMPPVFLPAGMAKPSIHAIYSASCEEGGCQSVGRVSFQRVWKLCMPHIVIMTPRTDVCPHCERLRRQVVAAVTEAEKLGAASSLSEHNQGAPLVRDHYRFCTIDGKVELDSAGDVLPPPCAPCSQELVKVHYTFDFAQNVSLPQSSRQEGPLYFKSPHKVQIFGVNNECLPKQINYLISEADTIGADDKRSHGPNTVASLLHHFFAVHGLGEQDCFLHADNCGGGGKIRTRRWSHTLHGVS